VGWKGDSDRTDSSRNVGVIDHRPSEGDDTPHGQVDFVVQPPSPFVAEELADKACLTKSVGGVDQIDDVPVKLQRKTSARNYGGRVGGRGRSRSCGRFRDLHSKRQ